MMRALTLHAVADACGVARGQDDRVFSRVVTDSRSVQPGDLFVALSGERFNAHDFLADVQRAGAVAAVVESIDANLSLPQLQVGNTVEALGKIASLNRNLFTGSVIGLTGSAGKTTTKEMMAAILSQQKQPLVTRGNLNNHLGVPLTLLELSPQHDCAVVEMGASALGEIRYLTNLAKPDVALVTNVAPAHLEGFGSIENVAQGKREIFEGLSADGVAVINMDNQWTSAWRDVLSRTQRITTFSMNDATADVFAVNVQQGAEGIRFVLHAHQQQRDIHLAFIGLHNVGNALAAAACCLALGIELDTVAQGLSAAKPYKGRLQIRTGVKGCRIIDDSYNANPASVRMAIDALLACEGEKILVLGDMGELGVDARRLHEEIGAYASDAGVPALWVTGELSRATAEAFGAAAMHFENWELLAAHCAAVANKNSVFLIKGSRSAGMDRVADRLAATGEVIC